MHIVHLELQEANDRGHRFSIGAIDHAGQLCGAAVVGRPVARMVNSRRTVEVTRLVTDGTRNACSALYSAAARCARELGYDKIQTYILDSETGVSLRAAGWELDALTTGGDWNHGPFEGRRTDQPMGPKQRWAKILRDPLIFSLDDSRELRLPGC